MNETMTVIQALAKHTCPICGRRHKARSKMIIEHMKAMYAAGYGGYDNIERKWITE